MAEAVSEKKNVLLCMDNSAQADWAFECKSFSILLNTFDHLLLLLPLLLGIDMIQIIISLVQI